MISATVQQQQQQVDNKKATNANYNRKSQINLAQYSNNRNILSDNNYYNSKDYHQSIDLSGNQLLSPQSTSGNSATTTPTSAATASLSIGASLLTSSDSTASANLLNEQISALFPKCRPKNDANLNKTSLYIETNNSTLASASALLASSPSSGDYKNQNKLFALDNDDSPDHTLIDNSRAYNRNNKMNNQNLDGTLNSGANNENSRQQPSNASGIGENAMTARNMSHSNYQQTRNTNSSFQRTANSQHQAAKQQIHHQNNDYHNIGGFDGSIQHSRHQANPNKWENIVNEQVNRKWPENDDFLREVNIWEKRRRSPNTTPASTVLNSPDFSDIHHYSHYPVQHQIKVGRSPVNQHEHNNERNNGRMVESPTQPTHNQRNSKRPMALVSDGEVVVFDDIGDNWRNQSSESNVMAPNRQQQQQHQSQNNKQTQNQSSQRFHHMLFDDDDEKERDSKTNSYSTDNVTKMIGKRSLLSEHLFSRVLFVFLSPFFVNSF